MSNNVLALVLLAAADKPLRMDLQLGRASTVGTVPAGALLSTNAGGILN